MSVDDAEARFRRSINLGPGAEHALHLKASPMPHLAAATTYAPTQAPTQAPMDLQSMTSLFLTFYTFHGDPGTGQV